MPWYLHSITYYEKSGDDLVLVGGYKKVMYKYFIIFYNRPGLLQMLASGEGPRTNVLQILRANSTETPNAKDNSAVLFRCRNTE